MSDYGAVYGGYRSDEHGDFGEDDRCSEDEHWHARPQKKEQHRSTESIEFTDRTVRGRKRQEPDPMSKSLESSSAALKELSLDGVGGDNSESRGQSFKTKPLDRYVLLTDLTLLHLLYFIRILRIQMSPVVMG